MGLTLHVDRRCHFVIIAKRGRFELFDIGHDGYVVAMWLPLDAPPDLVALSSSHWTVLEGDVRVKLSRIHSAQAAKIIFDAPRHLQIRHLSYTPRTTS